jgi:hypothetical protein
MHKRVVSVAAARVYHIELSVNKTKNDRVNLREHTYRGRCGGRTCSGSLLREESKKKKE